METKVFEIHDVDEFEKYFNEVFSHKSLSFYDGLDHGMGFYYYSNTDNLIYLYKIKYSSIVKNIDLLKKIKSLP